MGKVCNYLFPKEPKQTFCFLLFKDMTDTLKMQTPVCHFPGLRAGR